MGQQVFEFRGVDSLYVAPVVKDDETGYACGTPFYLAPVAEVGKSTGSSSDSHYYDNKPMIVISSEDADSITITMAPPELAKLTQIIGKSFDATTGMMVDSPRVDQYWALMYRTKGTDGAYRYVSRLKGQFSVPDEQNDTEANNTDATNTQIVFTGVYTEHEFTKGKYNGVSWEKASAKGIVVDTRYELADVSNFFSAVQTPDTIQAGNTTLILSPTTISVAIGYNALINVTANTTGQSVTWASSDSDVASVIPGSLSCGVVGVSAGTATITATAGTVTKTVSVVVTGS